jgi:hypothetical protein
MENPAEEYLLMRATDNGSQYSGRPFRPEWNISPARFKSKYPHLALGGKELKEVAAAGDSDEFNAAAKVEGAVNGTSLMLMFEVENAYLLFPGDAQWGTWNAAMNNPVWRPLLEKTTFYKIGHHGSHNATPITFVEKILQPDFWAMACTGPTAKWTDTIPRQRLLDKLRQKSDKVVRSDKEDVPDPQTPEFARDKANAYLEVEVPI